MTDASLKKYRIGFGAQFSGDDLICKACDFHRLARFDHSPQQAIFHSPVLIVQYDYLVASVVLGVRKMLLLNVTKKLLWAEQWRCPGAGGKAC